uniref:I/LWEQ domain-containing protein n=1 Tax=Heliothis virescens TaxID=7102 RepID=A0A2A4JHE3_HELVI
MILEAAKSIIAATSALVRAASAAQRELIDQGKVARRPTSSSDDGQWSEGLVSAARLVAAAAHSLVEAGSALVQGAGSEERLISSARQVASSTAQLLVACKVKADPSSESTRRLQAAGAEVIRSTDNLVRAARDAIQTEEERSLVLNRRMVGGIAQEIDARSEVLRIEKELEEARGRLTAIRQAKYKLRTGETSGDDTDTDVQLGYNSDASQHRTGETSGDDTDTDVQLGYNSDASQHRYIYSTSSGLERLQEMTPTLTCSWATTAMPRNTGDDTDTDVQLGYNSDASQHRYIYSTSSGLERLQEMTPTLTCSWATTAMPRNTGDDTDTDVQLGYNSDASQHRYIYSTSSGLERLQEMTPTLTCSWATTAMPRNTGDDTDTDVQLGYNSDASQHRYIYSTSSGLERLQEMTPTLTCSWATTAMPRNTGDDTDTDVQLGYNSDASQHRYIYSTSSGLERLQEMTPTLTCSWATTAMPRNTGDDTDTDVQLGYNSDASQHRYIYSTSSGLERLQEMTPTLTCSWATTAMPRNTGDDTDTDVQLGYNSDASQHRYIYSTSSGLERLQEMTPTLTCSWATTAMPRNTGDDTDTDVQLGYNSDASQHRYIYSTSSGLERLQEMTPTLTCSWATTAMPRNTGDDTDTDVQLGYNSDASQHRYIYSTSSGLERLQEMTPTLTCSWATTAMPRNTGDDTDTDVQLGYNSDASQHRYIYSTSSGLERLQEMTPTLTCSWATTAMPRNTGDDTDTDVQLGYNSDASQHRYIYSTSSGLERLQEMTPTLTCSWATTAMPRNTGDDTDTDVQLGYNSDASQHRYIYSTSSGLERLQEMTPTLTCSWATTAMPRNTGDDTDTDVQLGYNSDASQHRYIYSTSSGLERLQEMTPTLTCSWATTAMPRNTGDDTDTDVQLGYNSDASQHRYIYSTSSGLERLQEMTPTLTCSWATTAMPRNTGDDTDTDVQLGYNSDASQHRYIYSTSSGLERLQEMTPTLTCSWATTAMPRNTGDDTDTDVQLGYNSDASQHRYIYSTSSGLERLQEMTPTLTCSWATTAMPRNTAGLQQRCLATQVHIQYKLRTGETSGDDTDTDVQLGYNSDASQHRMRTPNSSFVNTTYSPNSTYSPHTTQTHNTTNISSHISHLNQSIHGTPGQTAKSPVSPSYGYTTPKSPTVPARPENYSQNINQSSVNQSYSQNSYSQTRDEKQYTVQSPTFSSFRPQEDQKQNYEGFTTRYETRLYDTPRPLDIRTEHQDTSHYDYKEHKYSYEAPKTPLSPKFNARELKFDDKEPIYSTLKKPFDGVGQTFSEHQKSTEAIPGGTKHSEYKIHSESYQSYPKTEFSRTEFREDVKSPFTSTPKFDRSTELVKAATPDYDRIASPYKETSSYGGPNYMEETTTEVKEIPNGTQKITTTKIYSSSPVNLTTTSTKYEPIRLDGIDELSKSFDNDSKYSTLDSRFNTLESKMSSDTSRSFMRPSEFQSSDYQTTTNVTKVKKPAELVKEIDSLDKKFSKQTITSETIERKSVMTSSHKSESSSTVTKKFGNF